VLENEVEDIETDAVNYQGVVDGLVTSTSSYHQKVDDLEIDATNYQGVVNGLVSSTSSYHQKVDVLETEVDKHDCQIGVLEDQ